MMYFCLNQFDHFIQGYADVPWNDGDDILIADTIKTWSDAGVKFNR